MNILYCGDKNILDGLIISLLSLINNTSGKLNIYVLTMNYANNNKKYKPITKTVINILNKEFKLLYKDINIKLFNITEIVNKCLPVANMDTRFTPYCMLRLYADQIPDIPNKILYLDNDVIALKSFDELYNINLNKYDLAGVLDNYGSHFLKRKAYKKDYLNSGVLLLNIDNIKKNKVFEKSRKKCQKYKMMMPDQTAINICSKHKLIINKKYNDQVSVKEDTIFRHYTTIFKFIPKFHTQTVKPWNIEAMHTILNDNSIDNIYSKYLEIKAKIK